MAWKKRSILAAAGMFLSVAAAGGNFTLKPVPGAEINSVLASVDGEPVCLSDVLPLTRTREYQAYAAYSGDDLKEAVRELRRKAVDELIDRKLLLTDYKEGKFELPGSDVEYELDRLADRMGCRSREEFRRRLRASGTSEDEVRRDVRENLICQLMLFRRGSTRNFVTPRDAFEYFEAHRSEFSAPEAVELAMLRLPPDDPRTVKKAAECADALKKNPAAFTELVQLYTPEAGDGTLGVIEMRKLRPDFAAAIGTPAANRVYGPIQVPDGTVFLKILRHIPAKNVDFKTLEPQIRNKLEEAQRNAELKKYAGELRSRAVIRYFF